MTVQEKLTHLLADSLDVLESEDTAELLAVICRCSDQQLSPVQMYFSGKD